MALWANLHGGFIFGLGLIAPFAIEAFIGAPAEQRLETGRGWVLFGLASLVAALVTPLGGEALLFPFKLMNNPELANIIGMAGGGFLASGRPGSHAGRACSRSRSREPLHLSPVRLAVLLGLVHMSLQHSRHEMLLAVLGPMLLAGPIAKAMDVARDRGPAGALGLDRGARGRARAGRRAARAAGIARPTRPARRSPR